MLFEFDVSYTEYSIGNLHLEFVNIKEGEKGVKFSSAMTFILRGQICFNMIDVSGNDISITQIIHCTSAILSMRITG